MGNEMYRGDEGDRQQQIAAVLANLSSIDVSPEEITRTQDALATLEAGDTFHGADRSGTAFRITADEHGFEFETDQDI